MVIKDCFALPRRARNDIALYLVTFPIVYQFKLYLQSLRGVTQSVTTKQPVLLYQIIFEKD